MVMVFPSASAQLAFAGGLGLEALSIWAEPSIAINPSVKHPTAKNAYCFLIVLPLKLCPSIEPDFPARRNIEFTQPLQTAELETRFPVIIFPILRNQEKGTPKRAKRRLFPRFLGAKHG